MAGTVLVTFNLSSLYETSVKGSHYTLIACFLLTALSTFGRYICISAAAKSLQSCRTLCDPIDGSPPASLFLGFSRQEHWSGLPFPSPMHESEKWKWSHSVVSDPQRPHDCSLPGASVHGIFQARVLEWGAIAFSDMHFYNHLILSFLLIHKDKHLAYFVTFPLSAWPRVGTQ